MPSDDDAPATKRAYAHLYNRLLSSIRPCVAELQKRVGAADEPNTEGDQALVQLITSILDAMEEADALLKKD